MGCGISKIDAEEAGPNFKRSDTQDVVLEQVLNHEDGKDELSGDYSLANQSNDRRSASSRVGDKSESEHHRVHQEVNEKKAAAGGCNKEGEVRRNHKEVAAKVTAAEEDDDDECGKHDEDDKESSFSDREDSIACPGSPSFREYCANPDSSNDRIDLKEDRIDSKEDRIVSKEENKLQGEGSQNCETAQELGTKLTKKKRSSIGRGIRNAVYRPAGWIHRQK